MSLVCMTAACSHLHMTWPVFTVSGFSCQWNGSASQHSVRSCSVLLTYSCEPNRRRSSTITAHAQKTGHFGPMLLQFIVLARFIITVPQHIIHLLANSHSMQYSVLNQSIKQSINQSINHYNRRHLEPFLQNYSSRCKLSAQQKGTSSLCDSKIS